MTGYFKNGQITKHITQPVAPDVVAVFLSDAFNIITPDDAPDDKMTASRLYLAGKVRHNLSDIRQITDDPNISYEELMTHTLRAFAGSYAGYKNQLTDSVKDNIAGALRPTNLYGVVTRNQSFALLPFPTLRRNGPVEEWKNNFPGTLYKLYKDMPQDEIPAGLKTLFQEHKLI